MTRPPLNARIRFDDGREAQVVEHTERGFKYRGNPSSFIPRWGLSFTGEGEIFCDMEDQGVDWTRHATVITTPPFTT